MGLFQNENSSCYNCKYGLKKICICEKTFKNNDSNNSCNLSERRNLYPNGC